MNPPWRTRSIEPFDLILLSVALVVLTVLATWGQHAFERACIPVI